MHELVEPVCLQFSDHQLRGDTPRLVGGSSLYALISLVNALIDIRALLPDLDDWVNVSMESQRLPLPAALVDAIAEPAADVEDDSAGAGSVPSVVLDRI